MNADRLADQGFPKMLIPFPRKLLIVAAAILAATAIGASPAGANGTEPAAVATGGNQGVQRSVKLGLNKAIVVDLPRDARDVLVSNPTIADAVIRTPRRIYLTGVAVGQANIIIFDRAGQQIVAIDLEVERDNSNLERMLRRLVPGSNITVEVVSDNIVLSGTVKNAADSRKAQDLADIFANGGANAQPAGSSSTTAGAGVAVSVTSGTQDIPTSNVINLLSIEGEDQVNLKVTVAEVNRNSIKQLGVDWNASNFNIGSMVFSGAITNGFAVNPAPDTSITGADITNITIPDPGGDAGDRINAQRLLGATLKALQREGLFRTLAEPTLTAISGESASFLAGGEFPVPVGRDRDGNITLEFKPFGVSLTFTPVVLSEGRISLRVKTEVSELSQEGALQLSGFSIPGLKVRRAETTMELPSGGAMVMGGMMQDDVRQSISGLPGLKSLPVLGTLFRSRDYQRNETELVIIVTPYLVKPVARTALARPDDGFAPASDATANFLGRVNRVYGVEGKPAPAGVYRGTFGFIFE
jgi:pilus assembly protein CpaC